MAREAAPDAELLLLTYLCGSLEPNAPHLARMNLPVGWAKPAFNVLQLEDYEWVTAGRQTLSRDAIATASERLRYAPEEQHYLSGFVATAGVPGPACSTARDAHSSRPAASCW